MMLKIGVGAASIRSEFKKHGYDEETFRGFMQASGKPVESSKNRKSDPTVKRQPPAFSPQPMREHSSLPEKLPSQRSSRKRMVKGPPKPPQQNLGSMLKKGRDRLHSTPHKPRQQSNQEHSPGPPPAPPQLRTAKSHGPPARPPPSPLQKPPEPEQHDFRSMLKSSRKRLDSTPGPSKVPPPVPPAVRQKSQGPPAFRGPPSFSEKNSGGAEIPLSPRKKFGSGGGALPNSPRKPPTFNKPRVASQQSKPQMSKKDMKAAFAAKLRAAKKRKKAS